MRTHTPSRFRLGSIAFAVAVLAGCVSYTQLYNPDGSYKDENQVAEIGQRLYEARCTACHAIFEPSAYPMEAWDGQIKKFGARAGLTIEQRKFVRLYLSTHAPDGERRLRLLAEANRRAMEPLQPTGESP